MNCRVLFPFVLVAEFSSFANVSALVYAVFCFFARLCTFWPASAFTIAVPCHLAPCSPIVPRAWPTTCASTRFWQASTWKIKICAMSRWRFRRGGPWLWGPKGVELRKGDRGWLLGVWQCRWSCQLRELPVDHAGSWAQLQWNAFTVHHDLGVKLAIASYQLCRPSPMPFVSTGPLKRSTWARTASATKASRLGHHSAGWAVSFVFSGSLQLGHLGRLFCCELAGLLNFQVCTTPSGNWKVSQCICVGKGVGVSDMNTR